jgi:hypothetical protein
MGEHYDPNGEYGIKILALFLKAAHRWVTSEDEHLKVYGENLFNLYH